MHSASELAPFGPDALAVRLQTPGGSQAALISADGGLLRPIGDRERVRSLRWWPEAGLLTGLREGAGLELVSCSPRRPRWSTVAELACEAICLDGRFAYYTRAVECRGTRIGLFVRRDMSWPPLGRCAARALAAGVSLLQRGVPCMAPDEQVLNSWTGELDGLFMLRSIALMLWDGYLAPIADTWEHTDLSRPDGPIAGLWVSPRGTSAIAASLSEEIAQRVREAGAAGQVVASRRATVEDGEAACDLCADRMLWLREGHWEPFAHPWFPGLWEFSPGDNGLLLRWRSDGEARLLDGSWSTLWRGTSGVAPVWWDEGRFLFGTEEGLWVHDVSSRQDHCLTREVGFSTPEPAGPPHGEP